MCQRIYIASRNPLPSLKRSRSAPHVAILPLASAAVDVRRWFSRDARHFAEAHGPSSCGCGFPEISDYRPDRPVAHDDAEAVKTLASYLEQRPGRKCLAELLLCWVGDEGEKPPHTRDIDLGTLRAPGFRFRRGEVLRVRAQAGGSGE
jgi:hypothetical protein